MKPEIFFKDFQGIKSASGNWYQVIKFLGSGGNGSTYLVTCTTGMNKGNVFALKVLHNISSEDRVNKFLREIEWMQSTHYPSILQQYDTGEWNGYPFVVMEHMPTTLAKEIQRGDLSLGRQLLYSQQLISAVMYLHSKGYIHRDIKPENIFIKGDSAILGDFGLIKRINDESDDSTEMKGYIAMPYYFRTPELIEYAKQNMSVGFESDVFQLGLVFSLLYNRTNPIIPSKNILDPIKLTPIKIPQKGKYGKKIHYVLTNMLKIEKGKRMGLEKAYERFYSIFEQYVQEKKQLDNEFDF